MQTEPEQGKPTPRHPLLNPSANMHLDRYCDRECFKAMAWRVKQSTQFFVLYLILILLNGFVLIWEISGGEDRTLVIVVEGIITILFVMEVSAEIITQEWRTFWSSWGNRLDFLVCLLCIVLFFVFVSVEEAPHSHHNIGSYMDAIVVGIRYGVQAIRLIRYAHRGRQNRQMLHQEEIAFDEVMTNSILEEHHVRQSTSRISKASEMSNSEIGSSFDSRQHGGSISMFQVGPNVDEDDEEDDDTVGMLQAHVNNNVEKNEREPVSSSDSNGEEAPLHGFGPL